MSDDRDDNDDNDAPIDELNYLRCQIIDIGDLRVARGKARYEFAGCSHRRLTYDSDERRVWCTECEKTLPAFDAFMVVIRDYQGWFNNLTDRQAKIEEMEKTQLHLRGARAIEKSWMGRRAPRCKCGAAMLPEDFQSGRFPEVSLELARQARKKQ